MGNSLITRLHLLVLATAAITALVMPAAAQSATVVNGDFETGTLNGWQLVNSSASGSWFAYSGTANPMSPEFGPEVPPPPAGNYAAIVAQGDPGLHIMYQDVPLEPYYTHSLSLVAYYRSYAPIYAAGTLDYKSIPNQQYRIDVMNPSAAIDSVNPADILATVFATKTGDPEQLGPTPVTVDLSPFAGQTVRLRFAEVDNQLFFSAGTDSVAITSVPPSNAITLGKPALNRKKGTAKLPVTVPGAGTLTIADVKKTKKRVKAKTIAATAAGTLKLPVTPTKSARKTLTNKGRLKLKVAVTFTPTGGIAASQIRKLTLKLTPKK